MQHEPPPPLLKGRHLLELGVEPGPGMGAILRQVYERQLDGRISSVEEGLEAARELLSTPAENDPASRWYPIERSRRAIPVWRLELSWQFWQVRHSLFCSVDGCRRRRGPAASVDQPVVFDVRGSLARFKGDTGTATGLGVTAADMPTKGLGISVGAHWYPLRLRRITFGVGGDC